MAPWMDDLEKAAFKLRDMGKKAAHEAAESFEKAKPGLQENLSKARDEVSDALKKAKPALRDGFCKAADAISDLREKARPADEPSPEEATADDSAQPSAPSEEAPSPDEALNAAVEEQLKTIRAAQQSSNPISDYIRQKYADKDE